MIFNILVFLLLAIEIIFSATDKFVFAQLKYDGNWDPYPYVYRDILETLELTTSIKVEKERRIIDLNSTQKLKEQLASTPFVILLGNDEVQIPHESLKILRDYVLNGGTIFIEDTSEILQGKFDDSIRKAIKIMFPDFRLKKTTSEHVLMKSFYLIRNITGRVIINDYLEYIEFENRPVIIYSRNNMIACWARDTFGNFLYDCIPNREEQRFNSQKIFLNIIIYSLCGTYKLDKVHQPFIEEKLKIKK